MKKLLLFGAIMMALMLCVVPATTVSAETLTFDTLKISESPVDLDACSTPILKASALQASAENATMTALLNEPTNAVTRNFLYMHTTNSATIASNIGKQQVTAPAPCTKPANQMAAATLRQIFRI